MAIDRRRLALPAALVLAAWSAAAGDLVAEAPSHRSTAGESPARIPELKTARDVERMVIDRYRGEDSKLLLALVLVNRRGEKRTHDLVRYRKKDEKGLVKSILTYISPRDIKGTSTLTVGLNVGDDLQYLYLPSLKRTRRIANADSGKSFAGTDWTYEDLREKRLDDYDYSPLRKELFDGQECYRYSMTPKSPDRSAYGRIEYWVRTDIVELVKGHYYDKNGELFKEAVIKDFHWAPDVSGKRKICSPHHMEMHNLREEHRSIFKVRKEVYNSGIQDDLFSPRGMQRVKEDF